MDNEDKQIISGFMESMESADSLFGSGMDNAGFTVEEEAVDRLREEFSGRKEDAHACVGLFKCLVDALEVKANDENYLPTLIERLELDQGQMEAFDQAVALAGHTPQAVMMVNSKRRM